MIKNQKGHRFAEEQTGVKESENRNIKMNAPRNNDSLQYV